MLKINYKLFFDKLKFNSFLVITKCISILYIYLFKLSINFLLLFPDNFYSFINPEIYISNDNYESDSDLDSDEDDIIIKNTFPLDTDYCIDINKKILNIHNNKVNKLSNIKYNNIFDNNYILSLLNNIKTQKSYYILHAEVLSLSSNKKQLFYNKIEITKKLKIIYNFHNELNINLIKNYYNNPEFLIILFYSLQSNSTIYKVFDLENNKDITTNKDIMFGRIKL